MCHTFNVISSLRAPQEATKWSAVVWWESFAVTDLKKKKWRVSWKCERVARDRVWESWSAGSVFSKVCKCFKLWGKNSLSWDSKLYRSSRSSNHIWDLNLQSELHHQNSWNATSKAQRTVYLFWMALYLNISLHTKYVTSCYTPTMRTCTPSAFLATTHCTLAMRCHSALVGWSTIQEQLFCNSLQVQF